MKKPKNFKVGDKVFAKVKGYPAWPAQVTAVEGKKYKVVFYGTNEIGTIKAEDLFFYLKNKNSLIKPNKRKDYNDALEEIRKAVEEDGTDGNTDDLDDSSTDVSVPSSAESVTKVEKRKRSSVNKIEEEQPSKKANNNTSSINDGNMKEKVESEKTKPKSNKISSSVVPEAVPEKEKLPITDTVDTVDETKKKEQVNGTIPIEETATTKLDGVKIVSEDDLNSYIAYAEYVKKNEDIFKKKDEEARLDDQYQAFPVKLSSGKLLAIKVHKSWPISFKNEYERAIYDENIAKDLLKLKEDLQSNKSKPSNNFDAFLSNFQMTEKEIELILEEREFTRVSERADKLKYESEIVLLDSKVKACLGLDKADPKAALQFLEKMHSMDFTHIMLLKHPYVVEGIRRLRNYVGNTEEWNLTEDSLETFQCDADKVRFKAEEIWEKLQKTVNLDKSSVNFWEGYNELVANFREKTKDLSEDQVCLVMTEPPSRQFFMDIYEDKRRKVDGENITKKNNEKVEGEQNCDVEGKTE